ncbi:hypothetical protein MtrunA17_Chr5g0409541 [Medicago truncatula]|uniref:Transmembrane protein n=1 Tax=Medicago truncatula TaxID=3880 RepID=A0A396HRX4_MEDTR|nr:hypothetical protein MtrunA17_Chr5g0409541 [Medicago truncatula]
MTLCLFFFCVFLSLQYSSPTEKIATSTLPVFFYSFGTFLCNLSIHMIYII